MTSPDRPSGIGKSELPVNYVINYGPLDMHPTISDGRLLGYIDPTGNFILASETDEPIHSGEGEQDSFPRVSNTRRTMRYGDYQIYINDPHSEGF